MAYTFFGVAVTLPDVAHFVLQCFSLLVSAEVLVYVYVIVAVRVNKSHSFDSGRERQKPDINFFSHLASIHMFFVFVLFPPGRYPGGVERSSACAEEHISH